MFTHRGTRGTPQLRATTRTRKLLAPRMTSTSRPRLPRLLAGLLVAFNCQPSSANSNGKSFTNTGAFSVTAEYTQARAAEHPNCTFAEDPRLCIYRLDEGLARELAKFFGNSSVTELGAGVGRYKRVTKALGRTTSYTAYDGMPDVEERSNHWVRHADLASECELEESDWVLTLEVAEHIPKAFQEAFLRNIDRANRRGVIISWSVWNASTGSSHHGHVNARPVVEVQAIFKARGYFFDSVQTRRLRMRSTMSYLQQRLLVFSREPVSVWVGKSAAKIMQKQRTDVTTPKGVVVLRG